MNVVFLIYRRPDLTRRVFAEIAKAKPHKLFVVADGPRDETERSKCVAARSIVDGVDWPCEVLKNYSDVNLGCRARVSSGLDWVFGHVDDAIILEDDCLPDQSFFPFCCELLQRYRTDERVMHISGDNFQRGVRRTWYSYYFSRYPHCWGWATWRRAWRLYDSRMEQWPEFKKAKGMDRVFRSKRERCYWERYLDTIHGGTIDSWASVWVFSCWARGGLSILPEVNLVSNIGFGAQSTHTADGQSRLAALPATAMLFPMRHPTALTVCERADLITLVRVFNDPDPLRRAVDRIRSRIRNRHFWGALVRRIPVIGAAWARSRSEPFGTDTK